MVPLWWLLALSLAGPECKVDKDCVVLEATCGGWEMLPKEKAKKREKEIKELRANAGCSAPNAVPKPVPMCVLQRCMEQHAPSSGTEKELRCSSYERTLMGVLDLQKTCKVDADCKLFDLKGACPVGCNEPMHKTTDVKSLVRYLEAWGAACGACKNKCPLVNQAFCETGTCRARFQAGAR